MAGLCGVSGEVTDVNYVGLDTETQDGKAILLATPTEYVEVSSWRECWRFLVKRGPDFCVFNLSYDARAILAYLPGTVLDRLRNGGSARYGKWSIRYVSRKSLSIGYEGEKRRVYFWDVYPYYDSSLDRAAGRYLDGESKDDIPKDWLPRMAWALKRHHKAVTRYCMRDAGLTERLWKLCATQYRTLGVPVERAVSPASLAVRAFSESYDFRHVPRYVQELFRRSYYGGRAEIIQRGNVGRAHFYDIHSAYPSVLVTLLDPRLCTEVKARPGKPPRSDAAYGSYRIYVEIPLEEHLPPLPYRSSSLPLVYPAGAFTVWTDAESLRMLLEFGYKVNILEGIELLVDSERLLFPDLEKWYHMRREVPAVALAIKKTLNSVYGKLAERRSIWTECKTRKLPARARFRNGKWCIKSQIPTGHTHFAVAAAVTAGCRCRLFRAMRSLGSSVISCHTDGIVAKRRLREGLGEKLGEWGYEYTAEETIILGIGMHVCRVTPAEAERLGWEGVWHERKRGFHLSYPLRDLLTDKRSRVPVQIRHAVTLAEAERLGWDNVNKMVEVEKVMDANMDRKRAWTRPWASFAECASHKQRSRSLIVIDKFALRGGERPKRRKSRKVRKVGKTACARRSKVG